MKERKTKLILPIVIILSSLLILINTSCAFELYRVDKDIEGKVIDFESGKPLQGVVVHATWHTSMPTPAGSKSKFYDIYETATNENGNFIIKGRGVKLMTTMESPSIRIFKAEYEDINLHDLGEKFKKYSPYKERVKWEGGKAIIILKKLNLDERKKRSIPPPPDGVSIEKVKKMMKEINKERKELGYKPYTLWEGEKL